MNNLRHLSFLLAAVVILGLLFFEVDEFARFFLVFFLPAWSILVLAALMCMWAQKRRGRRPYWQLAQQHKGTCETGGLFIHPLLKKVAFQHGDARVVVDVQSLGETRPTHYTQVHFCGGQPAVRCAIYPEGRWSGLNKRIGMRDIEIGSPEFDDRYVIQGDDTAALRSFLSPEVRRQIEALRQLLGNDDVYIAINQRELLVKKRSLIDDFDTLRQFTSLAIRLYDLATGSLGGIEYARVSVPAELPEAVCQVCGEAIESDVVLCRSCKTPHHHDCWAYYGACSTYGCLEKRYMRPQSRRARRAEHMLK